MRFFSGKNKWFMLSLVVLAFQYRADTIEIRQPLRKFSIKLSPASTKEKIKADLFNELIEKANQEKEKLEKQRKKEKEEIENKRNQIFYKFLLNTVSSSVLRDFYSRF